MNNVVLLGNRGAFFECVKESLTERHDIYLSCAVNRYEDLAVENADVLVFIGGETRNSSIMFEENYNKPKKLVQLCSNNGLRLVYLSSLSVFGDLHEDVIGIESDRSPIDLYGRSKLKFEEYLNEFSNELNYSAIYPASIFSGNGRSSIEKIYKLFQKAPLLKIFRFQGCLSYVDREQLIDVIISQVFEEKPISKVISSEHKSLFDYSYSRGVILPKVPMWFFKFLSACTTKRLSLNLRMIFRGVYYR